jgi:hypothetical protein
MISRKSGINRGFRTYDAPLGVSLAEKMVRIEELAAAAGHASAALRFTAKH